MEGRIEEKKSLDTANYFRITRSATYGFITALPLFVLYEGLILLANGNRAEQIRVGADVWIKQLMALIGANGLLSLGIAVLIIGIVVFVRERKKNIPIKPSYMGYMLGESAFYAIIVAFLVSGAVGLVFSIALQTQIPALIQNAPVQQPSTVMLLVLSIGAGLYEELIFRVVLVGGLYWILHKWIGKQKMAYFVAALVGAFIFSAVHYIGPLGDPFALNSFAFRFLFGLALNGIFLVRGFGVAAWTHAIYDVLVVSKFFG